MGLFIFDKIKIQVLKKFLKIFIRIVVSFIAFILLIWMLIQVTPVQNWIVKKVAQRLSNDLHTEVSIKHVDISLFNSLNMDGTLVKDLNKDTLLYAGKLKLRITDWFFLKDELVLKYIGLEDAYVNMYRKDSVWNYQFIADYFSPKNPASRKKGSLKLNLKKLDFKNFSFKKNDEWVGTEMVVKVNNLQLEAETFDLEKNNFGIKELELDRPFFSLSDFEGKRPIVIKPKRVRRADEMYFNSSDLNLTVDNLIIKNGTFQNLKNPDRPADSYFDADYLSFNKINASFKQFSFVRDTIKAQIEIATRERCGIEVRKLKADFKLTPEIMEFKKLDLITGQSHLQSYYAMHFTDFNEDFSDFEEKVTMEANLVGAIINSDDISFFAPALSDWKKQVTISGYGKGTLAKLVTKNLFVKSGNSTTLSGDLTMTGLPYVGTTIFDFQNGNIQTNYNDAATFVPSIKEVQNPSLSGLGNIKFKGNFIGTIQRFATNGIFSTNLGGFSTSVVMELSANKPAIYNGHLVTQQFDIGRFLKIKNMGTLSFDGGIKGVGLTLNTLKTSIKGKASQLKYNNYTYRKIQVEGIFQKKQFDGTVKIDDDNIDFITTVKMDFRESQPIFNVLGDLSHSNFQRLNLSSKDLQISGLFDLNFTGKNIDQFLGSVKVYNATFRQDSVKIDLDSLSLQSRYENGNRLLSLRSNQFDASIDGKYNILDLPNAFQVFLHNYYPAYIAQPKVVVKDQHFNFVLNTKNIDGYTKLFSKDIGGLSNSSIIGTLNTTDTVFEIYADVPEFSLGKNIFRNISFIGQGNFDELHMTGNIENISTSDSSVFPNTSIKINSKKDVSTVSIKTKATNTLNELNFNAAVTNYTDGVKINFDSSHFVINEKRWELEQKGEIVIRKNIVSAENVRFTQGDQHIEVATTRDNLLNQDNLKVKLQSINIGDFTPLFMTNPRLEGLVTGDILMRDFFGKFTVEADIRADQFRLDNDSVGVINIQGKYNSRDGKIGFNATSLNDTYSFLANGQYNLKDSIGEPLATVIKLKNTRVNILNKFLSSIFTNIDGFASGDLQINGNPSKPELLGNVTLKKGSLLVNFTQVKYEIDSATFKFDKEGIDFGRFTIKDKFGNVGNVSGKLYEKQFQNMRFNLDLYTQRLLLIDTKPTDNPQFYGTAIGKATMNITGPQQDIHIGIVASPVDSSQIYIPLTNSRESGKASYIVFKQYGTEMIDLSRSNEANVTVDLDLTANPLAKIDVILDAATGDIIKANGNGRLKIHAGTVDPLTIKGRYEVVKGTYDFNFQSFIKKPFIFQENSGSYIEWNGDPYNARLQVNATYVAENVRLGDLVSNQNLGGNVQSYQGQVYVVANISGNLKKPNIKFGLDFPQGAQVKSDETFNQFLTKLERDDNEMLKQVTYLIVFGSFAPYGENKAPNITALGYNTITGLLSNMVNGVVSNLLRKTGFQLDVNASLYNSSSLFGGTASNPNTFDRTKLDVKLNKKFFDNKVIITLGSDLDLNVNSNSVTSQQLGNLQLLPDVTVEFILSRDRKVRAIIFSRNNLDISTAGVGRRNRTGASISYRREFNHLLTKPKKQEDKKPTEALPVAVPAVGASEEKKEE